MGGVLGSLGAVLVLLAAAPGGDSAALTRQLDVVIDNACQAAKIDPLPPADDATFFRRVWLDLAGRVPPVAETRKFLDDSSSQKRSLLIEQLLASPHAANHWGRIWAEYYTDERPFERDTYSGRLLQRHLFDAFQKNKPYHMLARELLEGSGPSDTSGPANLLLKYEASPPLLAGAVSKKFLGCTIQCAQCHDHPHVHWKQDDFWGLAAYFARLRRMTPAEEPEGDTFALIVERQRGELSIPDPAAKPDENGNQPRKTVFPRIPGQTSTDTSSERRAALIDWLARPENPYFARHFVNRTWQQFFGEELVPALDTVADQSRTTDPDLRRLVLDLLADDFAAHDYDIHHLIRAIVGSQAYERAPGVSVKTEQQQASLEYAQLAHFARYPVRPLSVDQLYLSVAQATGYRGDDQDVRLAEMSQQDFSTDLPTQYFSPLPLSLPRSVSVLNGDYSRAAADMAAEAARRWHEPTPGARHIEWLVIALLSRRPAPDEMEVLLKLASRGEGGLADVAWTLLNSAEFNSNH